MNGFMFIGHGKHTIPSSNCPHCDNQSQEWTKVKKPQRYCKKCERSIPQENPSDLCGPCYENDRTVNS